MMNYLVAPTAAAAVILTTIALPANIMHPLPRVGTETPCDFMTVFYFLVTTLQFTAQDGDGIFIDFANSGARRDFFGLMTLSLSCIFCRQNRVSCIRIEESKARDSNARTKAPSEEIHGKSMQGT